MENEENQNQVSLRFPPPLEIAPRFPQSHNPDDDSPLPKTQNQKARKEPQRLKKPQPPSSGSSFDEKMLPMGGQNTIAAVTAWGNSGGSQASLVLGPISWRSFSGGNYWAASSTTHRLSSSWAGHRIDRTPWPLTGVRGSESGMARVCVSKGLSLRRNHGGFIACFNRRVAKKAG